MPPRKRKTRSGGSDEDERMSNISTRTRSSNSSSHLVTPTTAQSSTYRNHPEAINLSSEDDDPAPKRSRTTRTQPVRSSRAAKKPQYVYTADSDSDLDMPIAIPTRKLAPAPARKTKRTAAPAATAARILQSPGLKKWNLDALKLTRVAKGEQKGCWTVEGYVGIEGDFSAFRIDGHTVNFSLAFEDMDGNKQQYSVSIAFYALDTYPAQYETIMTLDTSIPTPPSVKRIFDRFLNVHNLAISVLLTRLLCALQGDDEARGGQALDAEVDCARSSEGDDDASDGDDVGFADDIDEAFGSQVQIQSVSPGRGFETAKGSSHDIGQQWGKVKEDFAQAKTMGYRPGITQISDEWVASFSIPFKNIGIDPNELALWDDGLAEAWTDDQRFIMLIRGASYSGTPIEKMQYYMTLDKDYKPSSAKIESITRSQHTALNASTASSSTSTAQPRSFFLSSTLVSHLKTFPLAYAFRTNYAINWQTADKYAMDQMLAISCRENGEAPLMSGPEDDAADPVTRGWKGNVHLIAFHWALRRFRLATQYCLNCGQEMELKGMRPYVCGNALCFFTMMSMGLGPSVEHSIRAHPSVCDLLVSFAHAALGGQAVSRAGNNSGTTANRMDLPLGINIVVPASMAPNGTNTYLDTLPEPEQRSALIKLIESLPTISSLKTSLDSGVPLTSLVRNKAVSDGAITVLRWVICSCRAYLKEVKPGQGVVNNLDAAASARYDPYGTLGGSGSSETIRQFTFVVGDPEQEDRFRKEIEIAKLGKPSLEQYPTMLAFHGSALMRWHNILRTGLDFQEIACGRSYGNGVYFAAQAETSFGSYAVANSTFRPNADLKLVRAMSLVELVNVPETFVSSNPFYVNSNVKQIKPFLLVVQVQPDAADATAGAVAGPSNLAAGAPGAQVGRPGAAVGMTGGMTATGATKVPKAVVKTGRTFKHDPALLMQPSWYGQPLEVRMPDKLAPARFIDTQPDSPSDAAIYSYVAPEPKSQLMYSPAPKSRYAKLHMMPSPTYTSTIATKAIMKEHKATMAAQGEGELPFWLVPDGDTVYSWAIEMFDFAKDSSLRADMKKYGVKSIVAEVRFPDSFPNAPPFIRILHPRFMPFVQGGGGNITAGGSVCNEILTSTGWNPCFTVEAIVRDVMVNMTSATPPGRLARDWNTPYGVQEAMEAYKRVAAAHGWEVPAGFDRMGR